VAPNGQTRAVPLHNVGAREGSGAGVPNIFVTDLTWHDGQLWAVTTDADAASQSLLFRIDPATGRADVVAADQGIVASGRRHVTMAATGTCTLAATWAAAHWSALTFDPRGPALLDPTHRIVWHTTTVHSRYHASPFALAFATARPTARAARVPALAKQGDPDAYDADPAGSAARPAVGLPDGNFAAAATDGTLVVVQADGTPGARTAKPVDSSNGYLSHPSATADPLFVSVGGALVRVDQGTLTSRVVSRDPTLPAGVSTVRIGSRYSTDPLAAGALDTAGGSDPVAWQSGSILLATT